MKCYSPCIKESSLRLFYYIRNFNTFFSTLFKIFFIKLLYGDFKLCFISFFHYLIFEPYFNEFDKIDIFHKYFSVFIVVEFKTHTVLFYRIRKRTNTIFRLRLLLCICGFKIICVYVRSNLYLPIVLSFRLFNSFHIELSPYRSASSLLFYQT